jgi:probable rRNA maturation factor
MELAIDVEDERWSAIAHLEEKLHAAAKAVAARRAFEGEINLILVDDAILQDLNNTWRGKNKPTNVLSFPAPAGLTMPPGELAPLGDIAMSYDTLAMEATRDHKSLSDHMVHLFIHGLLHLLGHDHETETEALEMEGLEVEILAGLGIANPYLTQGP